MKKILLITLEYPPQMGGVASYYSGMVKEMGRRGYEVEVIADLSPQPSPKGRGDVLLYRWFWPRWVKGYFRVQHALKKQKYDLLFVGHLLPLGTIACILRRRVPYVVFTHGMDLLMAQKSWRKRRLACMILRHAKLIVANSEFTKQEVEKIHCGGSPAAAGDPPQTVVVYPCPNLAVDTRPDEVEALRRRLGLTGKKVLLTLGRVVERKGHDLVIRALPEILKQVPNAVYAVAGSGSHLEKLQSMAGDLKLGTAVRFLGEITDSERPLYYALCDLFVMPSRRINADVEGFGLSFFEAAVFGKPSIGGRSGGIPEAILDPAPKQARYGAGGKTGILVDPNDASALARVVVQLLQDDRLRHELGQNAKARVAHEFQWSKQVQKFIENL